MSACGTAGALAKLELAKFQLCANMKDAKCCLDFPSVHSIAFGMED